MFLYGLFYVLIWFVLIKKKFVSILSENFFPFLFYPGFRNYLKHLSIVLVLIILIIFVGIFDVG